MERILFRGLFFIAVLSGLLRCPILCVYADGTLELEPIVITKEQASLIRPLRITESELSAFPVMALADSLRLLPIDLQSRSLAGGIQTDFSLRGSSFQGVLMLIDGYRVNDPQTAHHNSDIPLTVMDIDTVDVIPGAGSALYGADAIGGAVNFAVKAPAHEKTVLQLQGGMYDTHNELFSVTRLLGNAGMRISFENSESDGFRDGTDFKKTTASLYGRWHKQDIEGSLLIGAQEKEFGAYDFYTPGSDFFSQEWTTTHLFSTGLIIHGDDVLLKPHIIFRRHTDKFLLDKTLVRTRYLSHHRTDVYTPSLYIRKRFGSLGHIAAGMEYGQERIVSTSLGKESREHLSFYADESIELGRRLASGASVRFDDYDEFDKECTGSLGLRYELSQSQEVDLRVSRNVRLPSFTELFYNDPTTAGNPRLEAEEAWNYEVAWNWEEGDSSVGVTVFWREEDGFIDWVKRFPEEPLWRAENITHAFARGVENNLRLRLSDYADVEAYYAYVDKQMSEQGLIYKYGPNYSMHHVVLKTLMNLPFGRQALLLNYKKKPKRDGWFIVDVRLSCRLTKEAELFTDITNLLNAEYQQIEGIPQPGRWLMAGIRVEW